MVSDDTAQLVPGMFILRELDLVRVKGRKQALRIHELLATDASLPEKQKEMLELYGAGLAAYRERRWAKALEIFRQCLALWPQDGPSRLMEGRCLTFRRDPPPEDWDGTFEHLTK